MDNVEKFLIGTITLLLLIFITCPFWWYELSKKECQNKYGNIRYDFFAWCMVENNGKYIPEWLYIQQYNQNVKFVK